MTVSVDSFKRFLRRDYLLLVLGVIFLIVLVFILLSFVDRSNIKENLDNFISYPSTASNPISQSQKNPPQNEGLVLRERFSQYPFELSGREYLIKIPNMKDVTIQNNDEDSSIVFSGPSYNFVLKVNNEAQLGTFSEDPRAILLENTNFNTNVYRIISNSPSYDLSDSLNQRYGLNNIVWSFYTTEYLEKDNCNQIVQTLDEYHSCDMGVLKIETGDKKGFLKMYCGVNDEEQVEKCDDIVKNLSIILK